MRFNGTGAQAAKWVTGADAKNNSLTGKDTQYEREAQSSSVRAITLTAEETVTVHGFGYNAVGSAGGFDASVTVVVQKVG